MHLKIKSAATAKLLRTSDLHLAQYFPLKIITDRDYGQQIYTVLWHPGPNQVFPHVKAILMVCTEVNPYFAETSNKMVLLIISHIFPG